MRCTWLLALVLIVSAGLVLWGCGGDDDDDDSADDDVADDDAADDDDDDDSADDDDDDDEQYFDPRQRGPYEVGNTTLVLIDDGRYDPATSSSRKLPVEVWYPAADQAAELPRDIIRNFFGEWDDEILARLIEEGAAPEDIENFDRATGSARDAQINADGPFAMVLFSHGFGGVRFQNYTQCEYLASHGFVVVAPDHTGNALATALPEGVVEFRKDLVPISFWQRKEDFSFLIDAFTELNAFDPDGRFTGKLLTERVGGFGHSFGGTSIAETTKDDPRLAAGIDMASFMFPWIAEDYAASMMFMIGLEDNTMGEVIPLMRIDYDLVPPPKFKLEFPDAGHYTFSDTCILLPSLMGEEDGCGSGQRRSSGEPFEFIGHDAAFEAIDAYSVAFFGFNLRDDERMAEFLSGNYYADRMSYEYVLE